MKATTANLLLLLLLLSRTTLSTAITIPPFDPKIFSIQPNQGGSPADNCGDGQPVTFDEASWNANNVDSVISSIWSAGSSDPNFDFHQTFARKYGVSLYCPNIFTTCTGDPSSCSALTGSVAEKKQGWLGINALLNLQEQYLQFEKAMTQASDGLTVDLDSFQKTFVPPTLPDGNTDYNVRTNLFVSLLQGAVGFGAAALTVGTAGVSPILAAGFGALVSGLVAVVGSAINDGHADEALGPTDFSILALSDAKGQFKNAMLTGLDLAHNATFSNGYAGKYKGPDIPTVLKGGAFSGNLVPQAYSKSEASLEGLVQRIMASKLLEASWSIQNSFMYRVATVTDPTYCAKWYTKDKQRTDVRFCDGDRGLFVLRNVAKDSKGGIVQGTPSGSTIKDVATIGGYNIQLQDLLKSASDRYMEHGLKGTDFGYFFPSILYGWQKDPTNTVFKWGGMFSLPICEVTEKEWRDLNEGSTQPPCSCQKSTDQWNENFLNYAPDLVKNWMNSRKC
ncbi:MAG: hypothetical protein M1839_000545 [Geoglossum umbratile]|nr:MAG: hypothetical protein M1839_000545 [Geoglossum umbratile]